MALFFGNSRFKIGRLKSLNGRQKKKKFKEKKQFSLHCVFRDSALEPVLTEFVAGLVDRHAGLEVVDATKGKKTKEVK